MCGMARRIQSNPMRWAENRKKMRQLPLGDSWLMDSSRQPLELDEDGASHAVLAPSEVGRPSGNN